MNNMGSDSNHVTFTPQQIRLLLQNYKHTKTYLVYKLCNTNLVIYEYIDYIEYVYILVLYSALLICGMILSITDVHTQSLGLVIVLVTLCTLAITAKRFIDRIILNSSHIEEDELLEYFKLGKPDTTLNKDKSTNKTVLKFRKFIKDILQGLKYCISNNVTTNSVIGITLLIYTVQRLTNMYCSSKITDIAYYIVVSMFLFEIVKLCISKIVYFTHMYINSIVYKTFIEFIQHDMI